VSYSHNGAACLLRGDEIRVAIQEERLRGQKRARIRHHDDSMALSRGMQGLTIRIARRLNHKMDRRGRLFAERFHERILRTPTEVRRALAYVLNNSRRHAPGRFSTYWIDPCSSAPWFTGWRIVVREPWARPEGEPPVVPAQTWLLTKGWQRVGGLLAPGEIGGAHQPGGSD